MIMNKLFSESFTPVDAAWLNMDSPTNLSVITGVITFEKPLDYEGFHEIIQNRFIIYPRFRQRVCTPPFGPPRWELDPDFNLNRHLFKISLPDPANQQTLQDAVSEMMSIPLDKSKPLWEIYHVENFQSGSALICRLHHCIADGIALIQVLLSTTTGSQDIDGYDTSTDPFADLSPLAKLFVPPLIAGNLVRSRARKARKMVSLGVDTITKPKRLLELAISGTAGGLSLGRLLTLPPDRRTLLKGECGATKKAVWSKEIRLSEVKLVGLSLGGTVNDILLSALTGALRRYLVGRGENVAGLGIRAIVPVNLRPPDDVYRFGNRFGLVFLSLPIGVEDPLRRLTVLRRRMDSLKRTPEALVAFGILATMGLSPDRIEDFIRDLFGKKGSIVVTNVPGPVHALSIADSEIDDLMFWVPTPANLSLGISIISYTDKVMVGVASDAMIISDPETILNDFLDEFKDLQKLAESIQNQAIEQNGKEDGIQPESPSDLKQVSGSDVEGQSDPHRCKALTQKGNQCKNTAQPGSQYCYIHQDKS